MERKRNKRTDFAANDVGERLKCFGGKDGDPRGLIYLYETNAGTLFWALFSFFVDDLRPHENNTQGSSTLLLLAPHC